MYYLCFSYIIFKQNYIFFHIQIDFFAYLGYAPTL